MMIYNYVGISIILLLASITDIKHKIVSDKLLLAGVLAGLLLFAFNPQLRAVTLLVNIGIIGAILMVIYFLSKKALGLGDIKLIALMGLYITLSEVFAVAFIAFILSGVLSGLLLLFGKVKKDSSIPFAPFLLVSSIFVFYF